MSEPFYIDKQQFREQLEAACQRSLDPRAGLYGPGSMMWRLNRESLGFLGAGRAALLQLAHPWVANAIDQKSATRDDPVGRFHRTFTNVFTMIFGNLDQVREVSRRVHNVHRGIKGQLNEDSGAFAAGSYYQANEAHAMLWVHATLWDTFVRMYELVYGPLEREVVEQYYADTRIFAWLFGIPDEMVPPDWGSFQEYCERMYASDVLAVADTGREMGDMIFSLDLPLSRRPLELMRCVTAEMMPDHLREGFGLPAPSEDNRRRYERTLAWTRRIYPRTPKSLRYVPPYHEAVRRMRGQGSSPGTRALTQLWLGRKELVAAPPRQA